MHDRHNYKRGDRDRGDRLYRTPKIDRDWNVWGIVVHTHAFIDEHGLASACRQPPNTQKSRVRTQSKVWPDKLPAPRVWLGLLQQGALACVCVRVRAGYLRTRRVSACARARLLADDSIRGIVTR